MIFFKPDVKIGFNCKYILHLPKSDKLANKFTFIRFILKIKYLHD